MTRLNRLGIIVADIERFAADSAELLGLTWLVPSADASWPQIKVRFGEHGLQPMQVIEHMSFTRDGTLYEIALEVGDAEETRAELLRRGHEPILDVHLPGPDSHEYLYGRGFHGIPLMIGTIGDAERQMELDGPWRSLEDTTSPKVGCVSLVVDSIDAAVEDFGELFGMTFGETDPGGLAARAVVGSHRVKLLESPREKLSQHFEPPLASIDFSCEDVEATRGRFERAGHPVLDTRDLMSGEHGYYFGSIGDVPVGIYPSSAEAEILGLSPS